MSMDIFARGMCQSIQKQINQGQTGIDTFMVKINENDTSGYLGTKINGQNTQIKVNIIDNTLILSLDDEVLEKINDKSSDGKISININDQQDYLENKLLGTTNKVIITKNETDISNKLILNIGKDIFDKTIDSANSIIYNKFNSTLESSKIGDALDELDGKSETNKNNIDNNTFNITNLQNNQGKVKLSIDDVSDYLNNKIDNSTIQIENNKLVVKNLEGLNIPVETINLLQGVSSNIQEQINGFTQAFHLLGAKDTYAQLNAIEFPNVGDSWIINVDENQENVRDWYTYTSAGWILMGIVEVNIRDFNINPINLTNEVSGILAQNHIDLTGLIKQSDLDNYLDKNNYDTDNNGKVDNADNSDKLNNKSADYYTNANNINVDTTNFIKNLTQDDNTVQKIVEKLDKLLTGDGTGSGVSVDLSNYYTKDQVQTLTFQYSNNAKNVIRVAIGTEYLTSDNTFEDISNYILAKKQDIVNALINKGISSATVSEDIGNYANKINAIVQNSKIKNTKLNKVAGDNYQVILSNPTDIVNIATSVLEYLPGVTGIVQYECGFNNADSSQFNEVDNIIYDGTMHQKLNIVEEDMSLIESLEQGEIYSCAIDKSIFHTIGDFDTIQNDSNYTIKITGTYFPMLVAANGDINLNGINNLNDIIWTSICEASSKLLLIYSIDSGVSWHSYDIVNGLVTDVNINDNNDIEAKGMSINIVNNLTLEDLSKIRNNSSKIRFGYYFNVMDIADTVQNDEIQLTVDMIGSNIFSKDVDIELGEDNQTLTYTFNKNGTYTVVYCDSENL